MNTSKWFATALALLTVGCSQAEREHTMTVKEIETIVQRELPVGSNRSQVLAFLDARKIEHSDYFAKEKAIHAILRNTSKGAVTKGSIEIQFHFDDAANLKDYSVKEVFTGP